MKYEFERQLLYHIYNGKFTMRGEFSTIKMWTHGKM